MGIATIFQDHRLSAGFHSQQALALKLHCSAEYIRQIERGLKIPSDDFTERFLSLVSVSGPAAELFQRLVIDTRIRRKHGTNIKDFVGAEDVAAAVCRDARTVLLEEIGVSEEDVEYFITGLQQSIISELR